MANEITVTADLSYTDAESVSAELERLAQTISAGSKKIMRGRMSVTTAELAIPLGSVLTLGWFMAKNVDPTNFIELRVATGSTKFAKLKAGEICLLRIGSGITAPFAIADTATCDMEYLLIAG